MTAAPPALVEVLQGRYAFERELGSGGMATVYLARDLRNGSPVAVKVLRQYLLPHYGAERFAREIRITAGLQHPGILPVLDWGHAGDVPFYVTPYVEAGSLAQRLTREVQLPIAEAVALACDIAEALGAAHAQGFVHRDIKPSNILLAPGRALLTDFGIARAMDMAASEKLTETGFALGTPHYMSPEQFSGATVDRRSDVYSLGCVLFEMLAGAPPFPGATPQAVQARHFVDPVPSLQTVRNTVSPALEQVIVKAMAKVPADRYSTALEFRQALLRLDSAEALPSRTFSRRSRARLMLGVGGAAIAAVLIGILALWPVPSAELTLEADVTRVGLTLPTEQPLADPIEVTRLGVSGIAAIDLPAELLGSGSLSTEKALLVTLEEPFRTGRLTLQLNNVLPAGTQVSLASAAEVGTYDLTIGDSLPDVTVAAMGPVRVVVPGMPTQRVDFPAPTLIRLRPGRVVGLEFVPVAAPPIQFTERLPADGLDLTRIDRFETDAGTRIREVSTIRGGRLVIRGTGERTLRAGEDLRAGGVQGVITGLELAGGYLRLDLRANVARLTSGTGSARRSLLPSMLAWTLSEHPWWLAGALSLYLAILALAAVRLRGKPG